ELAAPRCGRSRQRIDLQLLFFELATRTRNDVRGNTDLPAQSPSTHGIQLRLRRPVWHNHEQIVIACGPSSPFRAAAEKPDLERMHHIYDMLDQAVQRQIRRVFFEVRHQGTASKVYGESRAKLATMMAGSPTVLAFFAGKYAHAGTLSCRRLAVTSVVRLVIVAVCACASRPEPELTDHVFVTSF